MSPPIAQRNPILSRTKVFFDGGLRPETGMETAVVIRGVVHVRRGLGPGTSMDAEWMALLHALGLARGIGWDAAVLLGDSAAVVAQARGRVRTRGRCAVQHAAFVATLAGAAPPHIRHIGRFQNLAGIALDRRT